MGLYPPEANSNWKPTPISAPASWPPTCNRHKDCFEADQKAKKKYDETPWNMKPVWMKEYAEHCHDECCEDCFGN